MAQSNNPIEKTVQEMSNNSYDSDFEQNTVEVLNYDPTTNTLIRAFPANALNLKPFDYVSRTLTNSTTETYTFKSGGSSGTTTNTVVIVYTDSTLSTISTVTKT